MTKADFIARVSKKVRLSKAQTGRVLDTMLDELTGVLKRKDSIALTGFGTFLVSKRKSRKGRNPRTGAAMNIPASSVPRFRPGKNLKSTVK